MKIGIISDSPLLTTGFGVEAFQAATALTNAEYEVVCFGLKGKATDNNDNLPFRIWDVDIASRWDVLLKEFFEREKPEQIIILIDLFNLHEIIGYCQSAEWRGITIVYLTPDGLPAYDKYLDDLRQVDKCIVTTETCKRYLEHCGIPVWQIAPPGVDADVFKPLPHREQLRRLAGLEGHFVVGVFGRNCERKQQPRVLQALASLADPEIVVYFHCRTHGYWHLNEIAHNLGVEEQVFFAELENESHGVAYVSDNISMTGTKSSDQILKMPSDFGYIERLNCCDLIINAPHSGDVEHIIIESQSCGVPLANTDDAGIMTEAVGDGGLLLQPVDVSWGRIGERIYLADSQAIADAIRSVKQNPALRRQLRQRGFNNVKEYSWSRMRETMVQVVQR